MKNLLIPAIFALGVGSVAQAQNVAINTDGSAAAASAILDVKSTTQGMLVPRMTQAQRNLIGTPAAGLLIYQTDATPGFYFYNGSAWTSLSGGSPTGSAGGDLTGNYPNPTIANDAVTSAKIANGTIVDADINSSAAIAASKISGNIVGNAANVTGTVAVANGGTGQTTANAALNALLPSQASNSGKVLQTNGTNATWQTPAGGGTTFLYAQKPADEVDNTTTLQDDDHLFITLQAGKRYHIFAAIYATRQNNTTSDGYRMNFTYSGTMADVGTVFGTTVSNTFPTVDISGTVVGSFGLFNAFNLQGMYTTTTGGTFRLQWCKNGTTNANPTIIGKGSYIYAIPLN